MLRLAPVLSVQTLKTRIISRERLRLWFRETDQQEQCSVSAAKSHTLVDLWKGFQCLLTRLCVQWKCIIAGLLRQRRVQLKRIQPKQLYFHSEGRAAAAFVLNNEKIHLNYICRSEAGHYLKVSSLHYSFISVTVRTPVPTAA